MKDHFHNRASKLKTFALFTAVIVAGYGCSQSKDAEWTELFDGETLEGWTQLGGEAKYHIEDGAIVGTSVTDTPNSFLTSDEHFQDFVLEFEVKVDDGLNSGVQFRSKSLDSYSNGRVHGYQFELDTGSRAWTAGIYDEARRGWLYPVDLNPDAKSLYKANQWNKARIETVGKETRTYLNGVQVSHLVDEESFVRDGFIGLQVHSIGSKAQEGKQVRWRNLRIAPLTEEDLEKPSDDVYVRNLSSNDLHSSEASQGWKLLFDGQETMGLGTIDTSELPSNWDVEDGALTVNGGESKGDSPGSIVTAEEFSAFEFQFDFKLTEGANSGVKYYFAQYSDSEDASKWLGLEYQILDNENHPDAEKGSEGNRWCAGLYDLIAPATRMYNRDVKAGVGNWNHGRIVANPDGKVEHWLNGYRVLSYDRFSEEYEDLVSKSKYSDYSTFGQIEKGAIHLQDHNDEVSFRSLKVREL